MKTLATILAALVLALLAPAPAQADDADFCANWGDYLSRPPAMCYPLPGGDSRHLVVQGMRGAWKFRAFARRVDPYLPGVTVHYGDCNDYPMSYTCVTLLPFTALNGYMAWTSWTGEGDIEVGFNTNYGPKSRVHTTRSSRRAAAGHEFLHVLGVSHGNTSAGAGLMTGIQPTTLTPMPSAHEWSLLDPVYGPITYSTQ